MEQPQGDFEIRPIEQALRLLDDRLRIVWNPQCYLARPGHIDVYGKISQPLWAGRWQVVRLEGLIDPHPTVIWTWGSELSPERPYRAVDWNLVEFFRQWDSANRDVIEQHVALREAEERQKAKHEEEIVEGRKEVFHRVATDKLRGRELWPVETNLLS